MAKLKWLLLTALLNFTSEAYKILVIFPIPGKSHGILGEGIIRHLLQAGHEVTYITPFSKNHNHPNLHKVPVDSNYKVFNEDVMNIKAIMDGKFDAVSGDFILHMMVNLSKSTLEDENVQTFLRDPKQQFDAVIAEWMFTELYAAIPPLFDCPLIWFSTLDPHWKVLSLIDEVLNPAYSTGYQTYYPTPFTLSQRVNELWILLSGLWRKNFRRLGMEKKIFDTSIAPLFLKRGKPVPTYEDLTYNASLVLGNSHVSMGQPTRLPQNYIPIGGYHIDTNVKPLPQDIKKVMDESKNGVIYFSMGSNLKSKDLPDELKKGFLKIFSGLKQTVLWKFEEILSDLPENVRILKWAPQQSILSHPNCILFITHGGLLSTTEAIHFGVPIIGIPVFADQFSNVDRSVIKGFAKRVDLSYTMLDDLSVTINEILRNTSYSERAKELSFIYHHRVATPGAELVHWVEHVVRTRGAPHLRSPALLVPWYQKMYLDLVAILVLVLTLLCNFVKSIFISTENNKQFNKKKKQ